MNIKQLRALREVMLTGSVSKAAKNLHRTQPAVSAQISTLEKEVGLKLFDRVDGRLQPVPEAQYVLEKAMEILDNIDEVEQSLINIKNLEAGDINVVSMLGPSIFLIPKLTSDFLADKEHVNVSLLSYNSHTTQELLSTQKFDVGIVDFQNDQYQSTSLVHHDLMQFKCLCAVPIDDPLAQKSFIDIKDLDGKAMALLQDDHSVTKQLKSVFSKHRLKLKRRIKTQYFIPQLTFVEQGLAYAIVDPLTVASYYQYRKQLGSLAFIPFAPTITSTISIVTPTKRPLSKVATTYIEHLKRELSALQ
ncbi:LysR family transcriptional regulator [Vibrio sp. D420a]|uniref:LysR family transcriptional regulator n=1 Tax=Vibrio sp. D420a TaxID=2836895 RepID=UPI002553518C|nr:LysR family transcriptional regulator [Vibrio sp. D420a]MDK9764686.1 LysR family transcriptional regulator [Vibrio sp. D420a]